MLHNLIDEQLIQRGGDRFRIAETVREFAGDHLATDQRTAGMDRLKRYIFGFAEKAARHSTSSEQGAWMVATEAELHHLRSVFEYCCAAGDLEGALRLANALGHFWGRANVPEGIDWYERALNLGGTGASLARGRHSAGSGCCSRSPERLTALSSGSVRHENCSLGLMTGPDRLTLNNALAALPWTVVTLTWPNAGSVLPGRPRVRMTTKPCREGVVRPRDRRLLPIRA